MKVIIVGCGAIGQVFGLFLQKSGVELGFYDRPEATPRLKQALARGGLPLSQFRKRDPLDCRLERYQVLSEAAECREFGPDQIWFTTPSPVYYSEWFHEFLQQVPSQRVVCFAPEGPRAEFFPPGGSGDRFVFGGITFISWQGDLQGGGGRPEAVNFWRPPLSIPLTGTPEACRPVGELLKKAGFRVAWQNPDSGQGQAPMTAVMTTFMAGLELSGWSLTAFRRGPWLGPAALASRQAYRSQLASAGPFTRAVLGIALSPAGISLVARLLPRLFPFDIEKYCRFHYTKTRDQSLTLLEVFIRDGQDRGVPVEAIQSLLQELRGAAPSFPFLPGVRPASGPDTG